MNNMKPEGLSIESVTGKQLALHEGQVLRVGMTKHDSLGREIFLQTSSLEYRSDLAQ